MACGSSNDEKTNGEPSGNTGLVLVESDFNGDTIVGVTMPITIYEDDQTIVFYGYYGVFFYDINLDKITNGFNVSGDERFKLNYQGGLSGDAYWDKDTSNIIIFDSRAADTTGFYYIYNVKENKLEKVDGTPSKEIIDMYDVGGLSQGWSKPYDDGQAPAKDLKYTSPISGKEYYPLANYIGPAAKQ